MSTIAIQLTPAQVETLSQRAREVGLAPEELASAAVQDLLGEPAGDFSVAMERVLRKNEELYRRLA
jgi:hypothetical protein